MALQGCRRPATRAGIGAPSAAGGRRGRRRARRQAARVPAHDRGLGRRWRRAEGTITHPEHVATDGGAGDEPQQAEDGERTPHAARRRCRVRRLDHTGDLLRRRPAGPRLLGRLVFSGHVGALPIGPVGAGSAVSAEDLQQGTDPGQPPRLGQEGLPDGGRQFQRDVAGRPPVGGDQPIDVPGAGRGPEDGDVRRAVAVVVAGHGYVPVGAPGGRDTTWTYQVPVDGRKTAMSVLPSPL